MAKTASKPKAPKAVKTAKSCSSKKAISKKGATSCPVKRSRSPKKTQNVLFQSISEMHSVGVVDSPKILVAAQAGYSNTRSDGFKKAVKELMDDGLIEFGKDNDHFRLTEKGIDAMPKDDEPPRNSAQIQERLLGLLRQKTANGKIALLWAALTDGKHHTVDKLAQACGYDNRRSPRFLDLIKLLVQLGLATKAGTVVRLTDIAFPFGRKD